MNYSAFNTSLADAGASSGGSGLSLVFLLIFGGFGLILAINLRNAAERFIDLTSKVLFGFADEVDPRIARFVGAIIALLALAGAIAEASVLLRA